MFKSYASSFSDSRVLWVVAEAENRPKSAHRYNVAEQQVIYKSEIERIWKAQFDSLSRKDEPQLTDDEEKKDIKKQQKQISTRPDLLPYSNAGSPIAGPSARPTPPYSRGSSIDRERDGSVGPDGSKSVLRIRRLVSLLSYPETGKAEFNKVDGLWQTEIIRDPAVIRAYVRGRQALEEEATLADSLAPTGDADKDKRAKKRYLCCPYKGTSMFTFLSQA